MKTIDLTPTWRALLPALVEVAVRGTSTEGRKEAMDALYGLADFVDKHNAEVRKDDDKVVVFFKPWFASLGIEGDGVSLVEGQNIINRAHGDSRVWRVTFKDRQ